MLSAPGVANNSVLPAITFGFRGQVVMSPKESSLKTVFADAFRQITQRQVLPEIHVSFYPFAGLNHTIRLRNQRMYVRAPLAVHQALAHILVAKLFKKRITPEHERLYRQYAYQPQVLRASDLARQKRGYKRITTALGRVHNLDKLFNRLNRQYFESQLAKPTLSWSPRRSKRILGHHDYSHDTIIISRALDSANVPEYVVEFVLYHEMLHMKHHPRLVNGRRIYHTTAFRNDEKRFARFAQATEWIEGMAEHRGA
jgi:hypothetical protein